MPDQAVRYDAETYEILLDYQARYEQGLSHARNASWSVNPDLKLLEALEGLTLLVSTVHDRRQGATVIVPTTHGDVRATVIAGHGTLTVQAAAKERDALAEALRTLRELIPEYTPEKPDVVPITFWSFNPQRGATARRRNLDAQAWSDVEDNYTGPTAEKLAPMFSRFSPGLGGQLILWTGPPGTGKTTALRTLAREWREWADVHYIVDPDVFFGGQPSYMLDVMMQDGDEAVDLEDFESSPSRRGKLRERWKVLLLEDCGEMLQADARQEVGQALSRLLNVCDGLIGRGLRILVLLTTNETVASLNEAVGRPGRCAARVEFETFTTNEARQWLENHGIDGDRVAGTRLADLFAVKEGFDRKQARSAIGFA